MEKKKLARLITGLVFISILFISFKIEVFQIMGSDKAFTLHNLIAPISFSFLNPFIVVLILVLTKLDSMSSIVGVLFLLPTLLSMVSFKYVKRNTFYGIVVPLVAALLFLVHPEIGWGKSWYFMLWIIPVVATIKKDNLFARSIISTFNAHAAGSVVFLYFVNTMSPLFWNLLIPFVIIERLVFSAGISGSYIVLKALESAIYKSISSAENYYKFILK